MIRTLVSWFRLAIALAGLGVVATQQSLWALFGGVMLVVFSVRARQEPGRDACRSDRELHRAELVRKGLGLLMLAAGLGLLQRFSGASTLSAIQQLARDIDRGLAVQTAGPDNFSLASLVGITLGSLLLGGFLPVFQTERLSRGREAILLPRLAALIVLIRVVSQAAVLLDARAESILLTFSLLAILLGVMRLLALGEDRCETWLLFHQASLGWIAGAAVIAWESAHPTQSMSMQRHLPDGLSAVAFLVLVDLLGYLVVPSRPEECVPSRESTWGSFLTGVRKFSRLVGRGTLLGLPLLPGFGGRVWLLIACGSVHHHSALTGLPVPHLGYRALLCVLVLGFVMSLSSGIQPWRLAVSGGSPPSSEQTVEPPGRMWPCRLAGTVLLVVIGLQPGWLLGDLCRYQAERHASRTVTVSPAQESPR